MRNKEYYFKIVHCVYNLDQGEDHDSLRGTS